jgi:hypothetical protein
VVFYISNQQAGVLNNVAGDQTIEGGQHGSVAVDRAVGRSLLAQLRREVSERALPADTRTIVERDLDACDVELERPEPNPKLLHDRLANVAQVLVGVGAVVSAGTGLGAALGALAAWLGPLGEHIRRALPS